MLRHSIRGRHDEWTRVVGMVQQCKGFTSRASVAHLHIGTLPATLELFKTEFLNHKLHPRLVAVLTITQGIEYLDHSLNAGYQLIHRRKLSKYLGDSGSRP